MTDSAHVGVSVPLSTPLVSTALNQPLDQFEELLKQLRACHRSFPCLVMVVCISQGNFNPSLGSLRYLYMLASKKNKGCLQHFVAL